MNKRQARLHVLDFILVDVQVPDLGGFYEDPETGEKLGEKDQQRLWDAWNELHWQLTKRASRLAKSLNVERRHV